MEDENPLDGHELEDAMAVDMLMGWDGPICGTCGAALAGDPDDDLEGDVGLPICGRCKRARPVNVLEP